MARYLAPIAAVLFLAAIRFGGDLATLFTRSARVLPLRVDNVLPSVDNILPSVDNILPNADNVFRSNDDAIRPIDHINRMIDTPPIQLDDSRQSVTPLSGENIRTIARFEKIGKDDSWFEAVDQPRLVSLVPSNADEYRKVYKRNYSITARNKLSTFNNRITQHPSLIGEDVNQMDAESFFEIVKSSDGDLVVILAHSEDLGENVVFPSGSRMNIKDIHDKCMELLKRCMILTCHGDDFGIEGTISIMDAFDIWEVVNERASKRVTVEDLILVAREKRKNQKLKSRIHISWVSASVGGPPLLLFSLQNDDD